MYRVPYIEVPCKSDNIEKLFGIKPLPRSFMYYFYFLVLCYNYQIRKKIIKRISSRFNLLGSNKKI